MRITHVVFVVLPVGHTNKWEYYQYYAYSYSQSYSDHHYNYVWGFQAIANALITRGSLGSASCHTGRANVCHTVEMQSFRCEMGHIYQYAMEVAEMILVFRM